MATWKKVIVSGSNISQLNNDSLYIHTGSDGVALSGSFSGSFEGDGSGLTGITAAGTLSSSAQIADDISGSLSAAHVNSKVPGILSGSSQIASDISGSFTDTSSSIATDIASLDSSKADKTAVTGAFADASSSIATDIDALQSDSGSFSTRIEAQETFSSSLDATFATEAELNTATSSLSASLAADIATNTSNLANLEQSSITTGSNSLAVELNTGSITLTSASVETLEIGDVYNVGDGSVDIRVPNSAGYIELNHGDADFIWLDGTDAGITLDNNYEWRFYGATGTFIAPGEIRGTTISGSSFVLTGGELFSGSAQLADDISGSLSNTAIAALDAGIVSGSDQLSDILPSGTVSGSAEGSNQGQIDLNGVAVNVNDLGTDDSPTFVNLTLTGDLEVQGTTTTIDSETLVVQDNIIALNGTAAAKGGLAVNDATGTTASGSLLWDGDNDYWIAGPTGSETKVFVAGATGDGLVSGSAQTIAHLPSGTVSGSAQLDNTRLDLADATGSFTGSFTGDGSGLTGVTADGTLSSSAQIADDISGSLSKSALNSVSAGIVSSSTQTVANLLNQATDFGTGRVSGDDFGDSDGGSSFTGSFSGDGSALSGITVDQNATVTASFSNAATASVTHNFDSDNILVVVYDDQDEQFIPSTIKAVSSDVVEVHFSPNATGRAIVARGGHIVSGSIPYENLIAVPENIVSGSGQILVVTTGSGVISGSTQIAELEAGIISGAAQIEGLGEITVSGSFSGSFVGDGSGLTGVTAAGTLSSSAQIADDISGSLSNTAIADLAAGIISSSTQLDNTRLDLTDATGSFTGSFTGDGSGLTGVTADGTLSSSAQIADDISGSLSNTAIAALGAGIVSASSLGSTGQGEARLTTNGVNGSTIDLGLQTTDSPTFAGLTVNGDLVVTGDTIESQVTNLNIQDKYILLNSGSTSGDSGIIFGGADGTANQGVGLFWDNGYNSNDGRLAIVNSIAAGATGDQTPAYHIAAVFEGTEANAATAQADHVGNIRVESDEIYIYV